MLRGMSVCWGASGYLVGRGRLLAAIALSSLAIHCGGAPVSSTRVSGTVLPLHVPAPASFEDLRGQCVQKGPDGGLALKVCGGKFGEAIRKGTFSADQDLPVPEQSVEIYRFSAGGAYGGYGAEMAMEIARESVTTKVRSLTAISVDDANALASECLNPTLEGELIVTGVQFGCMRSADSVDVKGNALEIVKAAFERLKLKTKGKPKGFYSMEGSEPSCDGEAPIAVEVLAVKEFCQRHVKPALVQELRDEVEKLKKDLDGCRDSKGSLSEDALKAINGHVLAIQSLTDQLEAASEQGAAAAARRAEIEQKLEEEKTKFTATINDALSQNEGLKLLVTSLSGQAITLAGRLLEVSGLLAQCRSGG